MLCFQRAARHSRAQHDRHNLMLKSFEFYVLAMGALQRSINLSGTAMLYLAVRGLNPEGSYILFSYEAITSVRVSHAFEVPCFRIYRTTQVTAARHVHGQDTGIRGAARHHSFGKRNLAWLLVTCSVSSSGHPPVVLLVICRTVSVKYCSSTYTITRKTHMDMFILCASCG